MGFLDFLFDKDKAEQKKLAKMHKTVTNMYVQPQERQYTLQQLRDIGTPEAIEIMLSRFKESAPNTTVDLEEKEYVYDILAELCRHKPDTLALVVRYVKAAETNVNWPLKILQDYYDYQEMADFLREVLAEEGTEYTRDPEKKQEVILRAAEFKHAELSQEVERFVDDANETVRFHAVETLLAQGFDASQATLRRSLAEEDSLRIAQKVAYGFSQHTGWIIPEDEREAVAAGLPEGYSLHADGYVVRTHH